MTVCEKQLLQITSCILRCQFLQFGFLLTLIRKSRSRNPTSGRRHLGVRHLGAKCVASRPNVAGQEELMKLVVQGLVAELTVLFIGIFMLPFISCCSAPFHNLPIFVRVNEQLVAEKFVFQN